MTGISSFSFCLMVNEGEILGKWRLRRRVKRFEVCLGMGEVRIVFEFRDWF